MSNRAPLFLSSICVAALLVLFGQEAPAVATLKSEHIAYDNSPSLKLAAPPRQLTRSEAKAALMALGEPYLYEGREPDLVLTLYDWDPAHAGPHVVPFWKEYTGLHSDIYVGWNDLAPPPTSSQQRHSITREQLERMGREFDERIWASDVFHFGWYRPRVPNALPPAQQAAYDGRRAAIMVYNIRDEAYWGDYRFYIAGYFWGSLNDSLGINAIFCDSFDWANRTGPDSAHPYLYEGTIAHEFQHLIHYDVDRDEDSFIDEGMADLAEQFLYGTRTTSSHIAEYLVYHRDSLVDWKGELFDYGNALLWMDYLWERAGGRELAGSPAERTAPGYDPFDDTASKFTDPGDRFIWELIHDPDNGLSGIADRYREGLDEVERLHRDFTLANLLDGIVSDPRWNYRNLSLGGPDSEHYRITDGIAFYAKSGARVAGNMPPTRKNVYRRATTEPWGAYYRKFIGTEPGVRLAFAGLPQDGIAPYSPPAEWFSGSGNMLQRTLSRTFNAVPPDAELSFMTYFDIEENWDYGYVEASVDGERWTQLPQLTDLPAATTDLYGSSAWSGPGGLTGSSGGWREARYSLSGFAGTVHVRFRYATDEAVNGQGWYVDDIRLGSWFDPVESPDGWQSTGWLLTEGLQNNDWTADVFVPYQKGQRIWHAVTTLVPTSGVRTTGTVDLATRWLADGSVTAVVSNRPRDGLFASSGRLSLLKTR